ncbi:DUF1737 domain-containing protein [Pseudoalteromonas 'SMAR']
MHYKILYGETPNALEQAVNELLEAGWQPQGGIAFEMGMLYQAMIKPA